LDQINVLELAADVKTPPPMMTDEGVVFMVSRFRSGSVRD
jgi:hypothetical protein